MLIMLDSSKNLGFKFFVISVLIIPTCVALKVHQLQKLEQCYSQALLLNLKVELRLWLAWKAELFVGGTAEFSWNYCQVAGDARDRWSWRQVAASHLLSVLDLQHELTANI